MPTKEQLEALYAANGWNEGRVRKSFANKQGLRISNEPYGGRLLFDVEFEQIHLKAYGFEVLVRLRLTDDLSKFEAFLCVRGKYRPLHKPVIVPLVYGFNAQANQLRTAVSGLQYVYNIAGVECLDYYPEGMADRSLHLS